MNTQQLPSSWQLDDNVQVIFPGNGKLQGKIIKVSFPRHGEVLYDIEIPYNTNEGDFEPEAGKRGHFRIHGVDQWFLSFTQEHWDKMREQEDDKGSLLPVFEQLVKPVRP